MRLGNRNFSLLLTLTSLLLFAMSALAQSDRFAAGSGNSDMNFFSNGAITGTMVDSSGRPISNARVELHSLSRGDVLAITSTTYSGEYRFNNVPRGDYEVFGYQGLAEARERVAVIDGGAMLNLRLNTSSAADAAGDPSSVGVNDFKVPDKARKAFHKAQAAFQEGNLQRVARFTDEALSIYPNYGQALTLRGLLHLQNHEADAARQDLEKALQFDSSHGVTYFLLAAVYNENGRFDDALRTLGQGFRVAPNQWQGYFEMSKALLGKNQFADALRQASRALELNPSFAMLHVIKGNCFAGLKDYASAITEMQAYLTADPAGRVSAQVRDTIARLKTLLDQPPAPSIMGNLVAPQP
jgi:tetratricopeptide (TPR) repeat protein